MNYTHLLPRIEHANVFHMPQDGEAALIAAAENNAYCVFRVDLGRVCSKHDLLDTIGKCLGFPDQFGHNWDALLDFLADMSWQPAEGYLVILEHCDGIHGHAEDDFVQTLQIFAAAADEWREQGIPFWCFVDMQADGINWLSDIA